MSRQKADHRQQILREDPNDLKTVPTAADHHRGRARAADLTRRCRTAAVRTVDERSIRFACGQRGQLKTRQLDRRVELYVGPKDRRVTLYISLRRLAGHKYNCRAVKIPFYGSSTAENESVVTESIASRINPQPLIGAKRIAGIKTARRNKGPSRIKNDRVSERRIYDHNRCGIIAGSRILNAVVYK